MTEGTYNYLYICPQDSNQHSEDKVYQKSDCSELSSWLLGGQQVESFLALHSLLTERIVRRKSGGVSAHGRVVVRVIELIGVNI